MTSAAEVRATVADVPDPELPAITIGMLGMIERLVVADGRVEVDLLPTFAGCPATEMIERDVRTALGRLDGVDEVVVRFLYDPPWTSDRISTTGHDRLREFGIAPPGRATAAGAAALPGVRRLPLSTDVATPCPYCDSSDTVRESAFGPTPCRAVHYCNACRQPFEGFKRLGA